MKSNAFQAFVVSVLCFSSYNVFALSGGFGTPTSGGGSSGSSITGCSSIGGATAGSSLSGGFKNTSGTGGESCSGEDSDADRMGNTWEQTYSLNKNLATDAYGDADSDGATNVREAYEGTLPNTTDTDGDGVMDSDDPDPDNASVTTLTVNGTYKGGKITNSNTAN